MWEENRHFTTYIRAAIDAKLPPKAVIFDDPTHTEWDFWDFRLLKAYHFTQDFMAGNFPVWWDESDRVTFDVKPKISKSTAAIDRKKYAADEQRAKNGGKPIFGQYFVAVPRTIDGGPMPTLEEWTREQAEKNAKSENRRR